MKIARVAEPRDRITGADFKKLRKKKRKKWQNFVLEVKQAAKRKFKENILQRMLICMQCAVCSGK